MSINEYRPHLLVIPEDSANGQLATGFADNCDAGRQMQILRRAGGWSKVVKKFLSGPAKSMAGNANTHVVLLLDFDGQPDRRASVLEAIPAGLTERVFVLGVANEPEDLRRAGLGSLETIGEALADECRRGERTLWKHDLLRHNADELDRMAPTVQPILFGTD